jgi:DNA-damage-inducible protein J
MAHNTAKHDAWFRARVQEALDDKRPAIPNDEVKAHFARRRAKALKKASSKSS